MGNEASPKNGVVAAIAAAASALAGTPLPYLLGIALMFVAMRWDGSLHSRQGCIQLQYINGVTYRVDTCNVKADPVRLEASAPAIAATTSVGASGALPAPAASK